MFDQDSCWGGFELGGILGVYEFLQKTSGSKRLWQTWTLVPGSPGLVK